MAEIEGYEDIPLVTFDGLDDAIIGVIESHTQEPRVCYDYNKCVEIFMNSGMTQEEAVEWMNHNVLCAFVGPHTPAFLYRSDMEDD